MGLAEAMAAGNESHGLFIVHRHARESFADVAGCGNRVGPAVGTLRVHVDQAHLHGGERVFEVALPGVALVFKPFAFRAPVDMLLRLPDIGAAATETESLEAHRLQRAVSGENQQVRPGNFVSIFLLDRPQQAARLIEVGVVWPAVEGGETLLAGTGATAAIGGAIGAGAMPGHADEQGAIMPEIGWPPFLRIGHQGEQVLLNGLEIEFLEFLGVAEGRTHRAGEA